jgi:hypothetical protein
VHGPVTDHYKTLGCPEQSGEKVSLIHGQAQNHSRLRAVHRGHRRRPERARWRRKQARSDAAETRLFVRAIIDCAYSTVNLNDPMHHDEYMRTTTMTLKARLLESGRAWSEVWSEDGGICIRVRPH